MNQLTLLGDTAQPEDDGLGPVQRAAMRVIRRTGTMSRAEAGAIACAHRNRHTVDETCEWCGTNGALLLESLIRRKLVEPALGGDVRLSDPTGGHSAQFFDPPAAEPVVTPEDGRLDARAYQPALDPHRCRAFADRGRGPDRCEPRRAVADRERPDAARGQARRTTRARLRAAVGLVRARNADGRH